MATRRSKIMVRPKIASTLNYKDSSPNKQTPPAPATLVPTPQTPVQPKVEQINSSSQEKSDLQLLGNSPLQPPAPNEIHNNSTPSTNDRAEPHKVVPSATPTPLASKKKLKPIRPKQASETTDKPTPPGSTNESSETNNIAPSTNPAPSATNKPKLPVSPKKKKARQASTNPPPPLATNENLEPPKTSPTPNLAESTPKLAIPPASEELKMQEISKIGAAAPPPQPAHPKLEFRVETLGQDERGRLYSPILLRRSLPQPTLVELTVEDELPESDIVNIINNIVSMDGSGGSTQSPSGDWWENLQTVGSPAPSSPEDLLTLGQSEEVYLPSRRLSETPNEEEEEEGEHDATYRPRSKKQCRRNTRRQLKPKRGVKPPEREKMTIADLIIWNPTENPIKECSEDKETVIGNIEEEDSSEPSELQQQQEDLGPQLVVTDDGEIVVDERSLYLPRTRTAPPPPPDPDKFRTGYSRKNTRSSWSKKDTLQFYKLLSVVGTDFSLLSHLLPGKSRIQIINKYKLERKKNKDLIDKARNLQVFDLNELLTPPDHWRLEEEELEDPPVQT